MTYKIAILIVDDDPDTRLGLRDFFEAKGFEVFEAINSEEALRIADCNLPDAVILDIGLPNGEDGKDVCKELRANPRTSKTPVLMLTCHGLIDERTAGLRSGADDYVIKPCDNEELLARVEALFRRFPPKNDFFKRLEYAHSGIETVETYRRYIVVLNIDVKGSSKPPKSTGDEYNRALTFHDYHDLVEKIVSNHEGSVVAWAGDGGTSEFLQSNSAIAASKTILKEFSKHPRLSKIEVRIGIAGGEELLEPESLTGKRTSQTHNRAGHFQKYSEVNNITIDDAVFQELEDTSDFQPRDAISNNIAYELKES